MRGFVVYFVSFVVMMFLWVGAFWWYMGGVSAFAFAFAVFASGPPAVLLGEWFDKPKQQ